MPFNRNDIRVGMYLVYDGDEGGNRRHKITAIYDFRETSVTLGYRTYVGFEATDNGRNSFHYTQFTIYDPSKRKPRYKEREICYGSNAGGTITPILRDTTPVSPSPRSTDTQAVVPVATNGHRFRIRLEPGRIIWAEPSEFHF